MTYYQSGLARVGARFGLSTDVPALIKGELGFDVDTQTFRVGNDTNKPLKVPTDGATGAFDLSTIDSLTLPGGLVFAKSKPGQINGVDYISINSQSGILVRTADNKFTGRVIASSDKSIVVTNGDGKLDNIDLKVNFSSAAFLNALGQFGFNITVSAQPPANPVQGQGWFDSDEDTLYLRVGDTDTGYWLDVTN